MHRGLTIGLMVWMAFGLTVDAQTSIPIPDAGQATAESIEAALEAVQVREGLDESTRNKVADQLRQALSHLRNRQSAEAAAAAYAAAVRSAPEETQRLRAKLDEAPPAAPTAESLGIDERTSTSVLEGLLASALVELAASEALRSSLEAETASEAERPVAIRERMAELRSEPGVSSVGEPSIGEVEGLSEARRLATQLEQEARAAELQSLEQELLSHGVRLNLTGARRDDTARTITELRRRVDVLQGAVHARRQSLADRAREDAVLAELAAADEHPVVRRLAEENARLTGKLPAIATEIQRMTGELSQIEIRAREIEQNLTRALERLELGGVNPLLGRLLIEQKRNLPRVSRQRAEMRDRRRTLAEVSLAQLESEERRRELTPVDGVVERTMAEVVDVPDPQELRAIQEKVDLLLRSRRDLLQQMAGSYASQARALNEVDLAQTRLLEATAAFERFLDRNLLWIPSAPAFGVEEVRDLKPAAGWILAPSSWSSFLDASTRALRQSLTGALGALFALGLALYFRRSLAGSAALDDAGPGAEDHVGQTVGALAMAGLRVLPLPFLMAVLAWALHRSSTLDDFAAAMGAALAATAPFLYNSLLLRTLGDPGGVMRTHFDWPPRRLALLRQQANRLTVLGVPLALLCALAYSAPFTAHRESLGRLAFVLLMLLVSGVAYALLHPTRGLVATPDDPEGGPGLPLRVAQAFAVGSPLLLALIAAVGYTHTALVLAGHLIRTYWLVLGLYFSRLVVWRWLAFARRNIARRERRAKGTPGAPPDESIPSDESVPPDGNGEPIVLVRRPPDLDTVDRQSKQLLDTGFVLVAVLMAWTIWAQVLPALGVLDRTELWSQTAVVDGEEAIVPVTLADLLLALLIVGGTVIAARNLPGLVEIAFLKRATLQVGSRYAINTLLRYVIILVGTIAAFSAVGWRWSQIQWLAAAISVGLGFGLQEIVANFVSGLVILFERPVRVGDTVTVGQVTGTVSQVRIRATTITDWDRKEIIVPNKSLITEQVINWTLTDPITRIVIPVGIGYGSDIEQAHRVMTQTLQGLPLVLDDPPPRVYFTGFGESSLDFKVHVFARQFSDRMPLTHAVHGEMLRSLRQEGIEIPFPQRDLHVKEWGGGARAEGPG